MNQFDQRLTPFLRRIDEDGTVAERSLDIVEALLGRHPWPAADALLPENRSESHYLRTILTHHRSSDIIAYAFWLSEQNYLECANIFLQLVPHLDPETMILMATNYRKLGLWKQADDAWDQVDVLGYERHDEELKARAIMGKGIVARHRGNLKLALWRFERTILDTEHFPAVRGQAELNRGIVLDEMGQHTEAAQAFWTAFQLVKGETDQMKALTSLGISLKQSGHLESADRALEYVEHRAGDRLLILNAQIERLDIATLLLDKPAVRRYEILLGNAARMPPSMEVDYLYKIGLAAVRQYQDTKRAHRYWNDALAIARQYKLGKWQFDLLEALDRSPAAPIKQRDERLEPIHSGLLALSVS